MAKQPSRHDEPAGFDKTQFKVCDLCGALNYAIRRDCFVCGWHGHFTTDPEVIHRAATERRPLPARAPEPIAAEEPPAFLPLPVRAGLLAGARRFFLRLLRRNVH